MFELLLRDSVVQQSADDAADHASGAPVASARRTPLRGRVVVRALQADAARASEAVEDELAGSGGEQAGLEVHDLLLHLDRVFLVNPSPGLDIDRLPRVEVLLKQVAVSVDPHDALVVPGGE